MEFVSAASVRLPDSLTWVGCPILVIERLRELQRNYELEQNANKKQDILEQILALVRVGWEQLFSVLSKEENPHQLLLLIAELNRLFDERQAQLKGTPPTT